MVVRCQDYMVKSRFTASNKSFKLYYLSFQYAEISPFLSR